MKDREKPQFYSLQKLKLTLICQKAQTENVATSKFEVLLQKLL